MELYSKIIGEGHPFVILHGLYGSSDNWMGVGRHLSKYFEVHLLDLRNHGQSPHHAVHNYFVMAADVEDYFAQHNLSKAILMGHSMGGKTAMTFALKNPGKVTKLIVVDISPRSYHTPADEATHRKSHYDILEALQGITLDENTSRESILAQLVEATKNERTAHFLSKNLTRNAQGKWAWRLNIKAIYSQFEQVGKGIDRVATVPLPLSNFPVLFVKGGDSPYITSADKPLIDSMFSHNRIVTIPHAGHWLHADKPEEFLSHIQEFCLA